jgi:hypothetical protein
MGTRLANSGFPHRLSLQPTRLACGKLGRAWPAESCENGSTEVYRPLPSAAQVDSPLTVTRQPPCIPAVPSAQIHDPARDGSGLLNELERHRSHGLIPGRDGTSPYQCS